MWVIHIQPSQPLIVEGPQWYCCSFKYLILWNKLAIGVCWDAVIFGKFEEGGTIAVSTNFVSCDELQTISNNNNILPTYLVTFNIRMLAQTQSQPQLKRHTKCKIQHCATNSSLKTPNIFPNKQLEIFQQLSIEQRSWIWRCVKFTPRNGTTYFNQLRRWF